MADANGGVADADVLMSPDCKPQLDSGKKLALAEDLMPEKYTTSIRKSLWESVNRSSILK